MMQHSNVIDIPRPAGDDDLLGVDRYVDALSRFISVAQMPTTLAIQGEWGSGKTSLMNQVRFKLCEMPGEESAEKLYHGIWINTWQYSLMQSPETVLLNVIRGVTNEVLDIMRARHQGKLTGAIDAVSGVFGKLVKVGAKAAASTVGIDASLVDELTAGGASEGPAAFRQALSDAIAKCLEEDRKAGNINRGFIFFIDDLDRLDPPVAVQILELLKNLFEVENCIFILAIDYDVVVKGLEPKFGPMTEKNEREFRSFFDKIIQLPFSMPVSAYNIDSYLAKSLAEIGYFTPEELAGAYGNGTLVEKTAEMALLSTGSNPRSVKRLINSLSLIRIMHEMAAENAPMSATEKLVNFGFVCIQIAYPAVYDMLLYEPNFKNWNERVAKRFRVAALNDDTRESLGGMEEFDEEWEQVLYRACQSNSYLAARAYSVSRLLNLIASLLASSEDFGEEIERILSFAAVTTVTSAENAAPKTGGRVRLQSLDDFLAEQRTRGVKEELLPVIKGIAEQCAAVFGDFVRLEFAPGGLMAQVVNNKSRERRLVAVYPRKNSLLVQTGDYTANGVRSLDAAKEDGLPADFFDKARKVFKKISLDRLPKEAE